MLGLGRDIPESLEAADLRDALDHVLSSAGWQRVMAPALERRLIDERRRLEQQAQDGIELKEHQARIKLLCEMLEKPREFFKP